MEKLFKDYYKNIFINNYQSKYIIQNNDKYFNIKVDDQTEALRYLLYMINFNAKTMKILI